MFPVSIIQAFIFILILVHTFFHLYRSDSMSVEVRSFSIFSPEIDFQADMSTKTFYAVLGNILCLKNKNFH